MNFQQWQDRIEAGAGATYQAGGILWLVDKGASVFEAYFTGPGQNGPETLYHARIEGLRDSQNRLVWTLRLDGEPVQTGYRSARWLAHWVDDHRGSLTRHLDEAMRSGSDLKH